VLNNLLSNALKFTPESGNISIAACIHETGASINGEFKKMKVAFPELLPEDRFTSLPQSLVVTVTDTGMGIAPEHMPELFAKFKQLDNKGLVPNIKGTGLGLAIAKGIIDGHGGIIGVVSKVGVGSTFYFSIPLVIAQNNI
jgi:signal transduction histidine kinase